MAPGGVLNRLARWFAERLRALARRLDTLGAQRVAPALSSAVPGHDLTALADRFPGAPNHWLATIAEHLDQADGGLPVESAVIEDAPSSPDMRSDGMQDARDEAQYATRRLFTLIGTGRGKTPRVPGPFGKRSQPHSRPVWPQIKPRPARAVATAPFAHAPASPAPAMFGQAQQPGRKGPVPFALAIPSPQYQAPELESSAHVRCEPPSPSARLRTTVDDPSLNIPADVHATPARSDHVRFAQPSATSHIELIQPETASHPRPETPFMIDATRRPHAPITFHSLGRHAPALPSPAPTANNWPALPASTLTIADAAPAAYDDYDDRREQRGGLWSA